jgi:hypothetical protein
MEEYITRTEFEAFKKQVEQKTEEMKAIRVDVHNVDVETVKQELHSVSGTWLNTLQEHYTEHMTCFKRIEEAMATKDDISALRHEMATMKEDIIDAVRKYSQPGKN